MLKSCRSRWCCKSEWLRGSLDLCWNIEAGDHRATTLMCSRRGAHGELGCSATNRQLPTFDNIASRLPRVLIVPYSSFGHEIILFHANWNVRVVECCRDDPRPGCDVDMTSGLLSAVRAAISSVLIHEWHAERATAISVRFVPGTGAFSHVAVNTFLGIRHGFLPRIGHTF